MGGITVEQIITWIGDLGILIGAIFGMYRFYKKNFADTINELKKRVGSLEERCNMQDKDIQDSKEERLILLKAQLACLKGLKEQGCNGAVTQSIADLEEYLIKKSHE